MRRFVVLLIGFIPLLVSAQVEMRKSSLAPGGGTAVSGDLQVVFVVGGLAAGEQAQEDYRLSEGFVGPLPEAVASAVKDYGLLTNICVYPNPVAEVLRIDLPEEGDYLFTLIDLTGKKVLEKRIAGKHAAITLPPLTKSLYLLLITDEKNRKKKVFRIEKQ